MSLRVRRSDCSNNPKTTATDGLCSLAYYHAAIQYSAGRDELHLFYIFGDMVWVKGNLNMSFSCAYVEHNHGADSYNGMRLMSLYQHHIIVNSAFSWWGLG